MVDITLVIPCYNDQSGLVDSLLSVNYPADKCRILVVDDGSDTPLQADSLCKMTGLSITVIKNERNLGIVHSLNEALKYIHNLNNSRYVARLDCGDICHPERFLRQVQFMDENSNISLLGTFCIFEDRSTKQQYQYKSATLHKHIIQQMHFKCSFIHPTVMFRSSILNKIGYYPENYPHAEDYAYFWKILKQYTGAILPLNLLTVALHDQNVSALNRKEQLRSRKKVVREFGTSGLDIGLGIIYLNLLTLVPRAFIKRVKWLFFK